MRSALLALLLVGCAQPYMWTRPNTNQVDYDQDRARCEYEAASSTATYGSGQNTSRTYGGSIAQGLGIGIGQAMARNDLIVLCMKSRGYAQQAGDPRAHNAAIMAQPVAYVAPVDATPTVAPSVKGESRYLITAEGIAKGSGCAPPSIAMTAKGAGSESFMVGCPNGTTMAMRCDIDGCRILR